MSADDATTAPPPPPPPLAHATAFDDIENSSTHSNSGRSTPVTRDKQRDFLTLQRVESQSLRREVDAVGASEDDSLSLARLLQEQERAYFMMQFGGGGVPDATADDETEDAAGIDEEEDESLALARALQEEEEQEYRNRILAMAGIDPDAEEEDSDAEGIDTDAMTYEELCELGDSVGKVVCGLTDAQIESLPIVVIDESTQGTKCAVCQVEFELGEDARELPRCRHVYHFECVQPWFAANKACPTCKTEVFEDKSMNA